MEQGNLWWEKVRKSVHRKWSEGPSAGKLIQEVYGKLIEEAEIGFISSEIKSLQEKSMDMGLKLKNRKISKQRIRHRKKDAKKRQRRDMNNPVRNRHEAPTRWHNPPSSTRSGRDKGRGQKKEKTSPNKPAQEGEDNAEEFGESYYVGATIEHDLTYATYFRSQRRAVTEEEVSKAFESAVRSNYTSQISFRSCTKHCSKEILHGVQAYLARLTFALAASPWQLEHQFRSAWMPQICQGTPDKKGELPPGRTAVSSSSGGFPFRDMEIETELNELWRKAKEY
ncbi:hypothetical protein Syun_011285 [Stephania yunnanensis]|uniref:Uncharacterized protein n=1 Tax=Stephania yunnanensis TaxID=152371 RepID=A0AAP0JZH6_9MAGN